MKEKPIRESLLQVRHELSTAVGHIESAYDELKSESTTEFARRMFESGITRLQSLIRQLDSEINEADQPRDTKVNR